LRVELLCTGDELLSGQVVDTNSAWTAELLRAALGLSISRITVVGDDHAELVEALRSVGARADVMIVGGGLGPTPDDLTVMSAAEALGVGIRVDPATLEKLEARAARRGVELNAGSRRQASVPEGATVVQNPAGSAPLFMHRFERARAFFLPGVPHEYRELMQQEVLPRLRALHEESGAASRGWVSRRLRTVGLGESELAERTRPVLARHPEVVAGFRTDPPENELRLEARADSQEEADALIQAVEKELLPILGDAFYARDETPLAEVVVQGMRNRGQTVALAESCTGGRISVLLTSVSGASDVLSAGAVTYTEEAKDFEASVPRELIDRHGVVSHEVAAAMAIGIRERWKSTFGLSVTGWAGPGGGTERDPVGTVYLGLSGPNGEVVERRVLDGDRHQVRVRAAVHAVDLLRRNI